MSFSFVKVGVADGSPYVFLTYKFALAAIVLSVLFAKRFNRVNRKTIVAGALIGLPLLLGNVFQTIGLQHTSVTNTAFITGLDVLLIPLFKWGLFRKPVQNRIWISCSIALFGLYLIVAQYGLHLNVGDLWTMACAVFFACYVMTVGYFSHRCAVAMAISFSIYTTYIVGASKLGKHLRGSKWANKIVASFYLGAAGVLASKST